MHHTDYSSNLRKAQHKTYKISSRPAVADNSVMDKSRDLLLAAAAAILVLVALFQMDPANAQPTMDVAGYGTLELSRNETRIQARSVNRHVKMIVHDDQLNMTVEQTFNNQTNQVHEGEFQFALPANATLLNWHVLLPGEPVCIPTLMNNCQLHKSLATVKNDQAVTVNANLLRIPVDALKPGQQLTVHLNFEFPIHSKQALAAALLPNSENTSAQLVNGVAAAAAAIGSVATNHAFGVLQPL